MTTTRIRPDAPATEAQIRYITTLMTSAGLTPDIQPGLTKDEASKGITFLKNAIDRVRASAPAALPPARPERPSELTPGIYEVDGVIYQVKPNQQKTRLYAKRLIEIGGERLTEADTVVRIEFEYEPGAIYRIREEHRMSLERGRELTLRYGRCLCCNRKLKAAKSVERGIGPVCITYFRR